MERRGEEGTVQVPRAVISAMILGPLFCGFAAAMNAIGDPRFDCVRGGDLVRMMAIGWCAGISFSGLLLFIKSKVHRG
jgi:hypothetical protein